VRSQRCLLEDVAVELLVNVGQVCHLNLFKAAVSCQICDLGKQLLFSQQEPQDKLPAVITDVTYLDGHL